MIKFLFILLTCINFFNCKFDNTVTITIANSTGGTIVYENNKVNNFITIKVKTGDEISLTAEPEQSYIFAYWEGISSYKDFNESAKVQPNITFSCSKSSIIFAKFTPISEQVFKLKVLQPLIGGSIATYKNDKKIESNYMEDISGTAFTFLAEQGGGSSFVKWVKKNLDDNTTEEYTADRLFFLLTENTEVSLVLLNGQQIKDRYQLTVNQPPTTEGEIIVKYNGLIIDPPYIVSKEDQSAYKIIANPADFYEFNTWNIQGTDIVNMNPTNKTLSLNTTQNVTIETTYTRNANQIIFKKNQGSGDMEPQRFNPNTRFKLNKNSFQRENYTFEKWSTNDDGTGTSYLDEADITLADGITLYANWIRNKFNINFEQNNKIFTSPILQQSVSLNTRITLPNPTAVDGSTLKFWNTESDGSGTNYLPNSDFTLTQANDIIFYAIWNTTTTSSKNIIVKFNANGVNAKIESEIINSSIGATINMPKLETAADVTQKFTYWADNVDGNGIAYEEGSEWVATGDKTFYAIYDTEVFKIQFDKNSGEGDMKDQFIGQNKSATINKNLFTKSGSAFSGWTDNPLSLNVVTYNDEEIYTIGNKDVTFFAVWASDFYALKFNPNGGAGSMENQSIKFGTTAKINKNTFTKPGFTFVGWKSSFPLLTDIDYADEANYTMSTLGATIYAVWRENP